MRIGQRTNLLRAAANALYTYGRHKALCSKVQVKGCTTCDCGWDNVRKEANAALATEWEARAESIKKHDTEVRELRPQKKRALTANPSWRAEFLRQATLVFLAALMLAFALPAYAQSVTRCWQPVRAITAPTCPDSASVDSLTARSPFTHPIATGMQSMMALGDTMQLQATIIRGYLFVGPTMQGRAPNTASGVVWRSNSPQLEVTSTGRVTALAAGRGIVTALQGGRKSTTEILVSTPAKAPTAPLIAELPRASVDTRMPEMPMSGDTLYMVNDVWFCRGPSCSATLIRHGLSPLPAAVLPWILVGKP